MAAQRTAARPRPGLAVLIGLIACLVGAPAAAQVIGIDCTGDLSTLGGLDPVESTDLIGVVPQQNWNSTGEGVESGFTSLVSASGVATPAVASWSFIGDGWSQNTQNGGGRIPVDKNHRLMQGLLWADAANPGTLTVSGLDQVFGGAPYQVIVYMDAWSLNTPPAHQHSVQLNAEVPIPVTLDADYTGPGAAFDDATSDGAGNYLVYSGVVGNSFTLTLLANPGSNAWLNGVQIVGAQPPQPPQDRIALDLTGDLDLSPVAATDPMGVESQKHWNVTDPGRELGSVTGLIGASGFVHEGVVASWDFNGDGISQNVVDDFEPANKNHKLMQGLLWDDTTSATFTMSGLADVFGPGAPYDVILYMDAWAIENPPHEQDVQLDAEAPVNVLMNADFSDPAPAFDNATHDGAGNYYRYRALTGDSFTITLHPGSVGDTVWLNGVQVVPATAIPPIPALGLPASAALAAALALVGGLFRRRSAA